MTPDDIEHFKKCGYLYVRHFYDYENEIQYAQDDISYLCRLAPRPSVLYDAAKKLPRLMRLAVSPRHDEAARQLLGSSFVGVANRGWGPRIDGPNNAHATNIHQDYVIQRCSQNSLVFWAPLVLVEEDMGPPIFYPGSHKEGVFSDPEEASQRFEELRTYPLRPSDCLIMHALLLHKSGVNRSKRTRWAIISRYFDFTDETGRAINWEGRLDNRG